MILDQILICTGVPQGTISCALLFIVYVRDTGDIRSNTDMYRCPSRNYFMSLVINNLC